jgi:acyl-CoA synthetase (AMP-forming)/AMP-acid ligase II
MASEIEMPDANPGDDGDKVNAQGTEEDVSNSNHHSHNNSLPDPDTLLKRLALHAEQTPSKVAFTFLTSGPNGGKVQQHYTYQELDERTTALARRLLDSSGIAAGDCVVLVYPPCIEFIATFLACCKAGITAVPVYPPNPVRRETIKAFSGIVEGCGAKVALTSEDYQHMKKLAGIKNGLARLTKGSKQQQVKWPELQWIVTDQKNLHHSLSKQEAILMKDRNDEKHDDAANSDTQRDSICFLQYTSGSTSEPKGVMVSHGNLAHNLQIITRELQASGDTVVVSWLPQYHDMGLIGAYLGILYCGGSGYYMSPLAFLQRPMLWIEAMSKYKSTHVQAPNFAYKLTARKCAVADYPQTPNGNSTKSNSNNKNVPLDLSSLRHMINGAEPIDIHGMEQFYKIFGNFGLKRGVIFPTYGLAEHTLFVCSGGTHVLTLDKAKLEVDGIVEEIDNTKAADSSDETTRSLVGCGHPSRQNIDVRIVHPETCFEEGRGHVGEIWIRSPSKARGYYKNPQLTKDSFLAEILIAPSTSKEENEPAKEEEEGDGETHQKESANSSDNNNSNNDDDPSVGYLRTGDLGFMHKEELFICGRLKDLIIVGGRNYYPQDIEATAESTSDLLRPGCCAAFSLDSRAGLEGGGTEEVALIMELRDILSKNVSCIEGSAPARNFLGVSFLL